MVNGFGGEASLSKVAGVGHVYVFKRIGWAA